MEHGKPCGACGETKPLASFYVNSGRPGGRHSTCKECNNKRRAEGRERHRSRYLARTKVSNAVRSRRLVKEPCEVCGSLEVQAHHDDYSKPLDVRWLCDPHHREWHKHNEAKEAAA